MGNEQWENEELVTLIQAGERGRLPVLWEQVERFAAMQAGKRARLLRGAGGVTEEDLYQSGYLALVKAVETFDPAREVKFISWYAWCLRAAFNAATGYRSEKQKRDPLHLALSIDTPLGDGEDGLTIADTLADPDSLQDFEEAEEGLWRSQLHTALESALDTLPEPQRDTLRRRFWGGETLRAIARDMGVSMEVIRQREYKGVKAMRHPRISRELRQFIEEKTRYFSGTGLAAFRETGMSQPEHLAILREEWAEG